MKSAMKVMVIVKATKNSEAGSSSPPWASVAHEAAKRDIWKS